MNMVWSNDTTEAASVDAQYQWYASSDEDGPGIRRSTFKNQKPTARPRTSEVKKKPTTEHVYKNGEDGKQVSPVLGLDLRFLIFDF